MEWLQQQTTQSGSTIDLEESNGKNVLLKSGGEGLDKRVK